MGPISIAAPAPASAQGLFDFLFGNRPPPPPPPPPPQVRGFAPFDELFRPPVHRREQRTAIRSANGPYAAYCVRLCDGRYFPIQGHRRASAVEQCSSLCPASETQLFSGSSIDRAVASNGRRYSDLDNAFVYRERLVPGCTCDGVSAVGVARVPVTDDHTLRHGDIVATNSGLSVYSGTDNHRQAAFTPVDQARMSKGLRDHLAEVKVRPQLPAASATTGAAPAQPADATSSVEPARR
jgi:hypothetical protein